jgi:diguanylate cyclase (GGDEF)-like protein
MRTSTRRLMELSVRCQLGAADATCAEGLQTTIDSLDGDWRNYQRLPTFLGEPNHWQEIERALDDARRAAGGMPEGWKPEGGPIDLGRLQRATEALDAGLDALIRLNVEQEAWLASEIQRLGRRSKFVTLAVDGFGLVFTAFMGILALRLVQRHTSMRERHLRDLSHVDEMTGLFNRRGFMVEAQEQMHRAERGRFKLLFCYADLDSLKQINDRLGHPAGDRAIVEAGALLRSTFRASDTVARVGGDEFVAIAAEASAGTAMALIERLRENLAQRNQRPDRGFDLRLSTGIAWYDPEHPEPIETLLNRADAAMYQNKHPSLKLAGPASGGSGV